MSLKFKLDTLDGLDEAAKTFYKPGPDGKGFVLDMDDDPAKETIAKIRKERDDLEKSLKEREKQEADAKAAKEREDLEKKGEYEKLRAQDAEAIKAAKDRAEALELKIRNGARDRAALEAMTEAGAIPKALMPHVQDQLEVLPDGDGSKVVVKGDAGKPIKDFISGLKEEMPWGFQPTGASGTGAPAHQPGGANAHAAIFDPKSPTYNYTKQMELAKTNPALFQTLRTQFPETKQE